jgi:proteasome lid subunit RPN8/RPN11
LRLTPYAWAKLIFCRDLGPTEVGGFGISSAADPFLVEDFCLVRQQCTPMTVAFHDEAVADYFDSQVDQGRTPAQFARIWIHTHPGSSSLPSATDEATFERCFGAADWAVMLIVACRGQTYARLRVGTGPVAGHIRLPVELDFSGSFPAATPDHWETHYWENVAQDLRPWGDVCTQRILPPERRLCRPDEACWPDEAWCVDSPLGSISVTSGWEELHG